MGQDDDAGKFVRSRPLWPIAIGVILIAGVVLAFVFWPSDPSPTRVLVSVRGCAPGCVSALSSALHARLSETFDVVLPAEGQEPADAEAARAAASEQGAEHAV